VSGVFTLKKKPEPGALAEVGRVQMVVIPAVGRGFIRALGIHLPVVIPAKERHSRERGNPSAAELLPALIESKDR